MSDETKPDCLFCKHSGHNHSGKNICHGPPDLGPVTGHEAADCRFYQTRKLVNPVNPVPSHLATQVGGGHYKHLSIQPAEYCQRNRLNFCESSVIKYVTRHRAKNGRQDIEKAIHFLNLLLEIDYPEPPKP